MSKAGSDVTTLIIKFTRRRNHIHHQMASSPVRMVLVCLLVSSFYAVLGKAESKYVDEAKTRLVINTSRIVATVGDNFLCATLDWWPSTKCNYGSCPWGEAGLLNLDLGNPRLEQAMAGLAPFMVRAGGTLQDLVVYKLGNLLTSEPCLPFEFNETALFNFTGGCLSMERWDALNALFIKTGVTVAFGINALYGRSKSAEEYTVVEPWDPSNTENFIRYTRERAYPVTAWELGNELLGNGIGKTVSTELYDADLKKLRRIVNDVYREDATKPLVVAPDSFYDVGSNAESIPSLLRASGPIVDVTTRHIYNLGPGLTETEVLISTILNPVVASTEAANYRSLEGILKSHPYTKAWIGEAGGAFNSGRDGVSNAFIFAFWYLDQLGTASIHDNQAFCRQTFVGGHYGLIDLNFNPNPDYYGALLWRKLMGNGVLTVDITNGTNASNRTNDVRAYAHCQKDNKHGLTLLVLNYSNSTKHNLDVKLLGYRGPHTQKSSASRLEYHMSPANGTVTSRIVLLNGEPLLVSPSGQIPTLSPISVDPSRPIWLEPLTYAYVVIPDANAPVCLKA